MRRFGADLRNLPMLARWTLRALCVWLACCTSAQAIDPDVPIAKLRHTVWQENDGLPSGVKTDAVQTSDGFLWLSTFTGLIRFDGLRFETVTLPRNERLASGSVFALHAPRSGGLWVGFAFGGVGLLKDGHWKLFTVEDGLPAGSVRAIAEDADGVIWVATTRGWARIQNNQVSVLGEEWGVPPGSVGGLMVDSEGAMWATLRDARVFYLVRGERQFRRLPGSFNIESGAQQIALSQSPAGAIWLLDDLGLHRLDIDRLADGRSHSAGRANLLFDHDGAMWYVQKEGITRIGHPDAVPKGATLGRVQLERDRFPLPDAPNRMLLQSNEGLVWMVSDRQLHRFSVSNVEQLDLSGLKAELTSVGFGAADEGGLWVMPFIGPLIEFENGQIRKNGTLSDLTAIARIADGSAWLAGTQGLWRHEAKRFIHVPMPDDTEGSEVQAIAGRSADDLWVSVVRKGVFRRKLGVWSDRGGLRELPKSPALSACSEAQGRVWFGYPDSQIAMVDGDHVRLFGSHEGVTVGFISALHCRGQHVWAGGEFGLLLWNGQAFQPALVTNTRAFEFITGIVETSSGDLWLNTAVGIVHVTPAEVRQALADPSHHLALEVFDRLDGYTGTGARIRPLPTAIEGTDGKLWFASNSGVFSIDPARIQRDLVPPKVIIQGLAVDGRPYPARALIALPQGTTAVRIDYVGLSLATPERVQYRYRLDGVDSTWKDVGSQHQAFYTSLSPGSYQFHVIASNRDGVWNETGKTLDFSIAPSFVQTRGFTVLCVLAAASVIALLFRLRVRQVAARLRWRLDAQLAERDRIARELHDTLLQSTQGLILRFQAVANRIGDDDPNREMLEQALDRADEVLTEGRERVRGLRQPEGSGFHLDQVLREAGDELIAGSSVSFRFTAEGEEQALPAEPGHEIYLIAREAIVNALRHAQAKAIDVTVFHSTSEVRVVVGDDGIGIDTETLHAGARSGHWGLRGMRERAERIGASLHIRLRPERGTEIEIRLAMTASNTERS